MNRLLKPTLTWVNSIKIKYKKIKLQIKLQIKLKSHEGGGKRAKVFCLNRNETVEHFIFCCPFFD